jgi:hypothetical protein
MNRKVEKWMVAVSVFAALAVASVPAVAQTAAQKPHSGNFSLPVQVVNQPTVNVGNTPSVNVANTPTVTLSGGASVAVANPTDNQGNPIPLATVQAVQLYGSSCTFQFQGAPNSACFFAPIPGGKQLVVQEFDAAGDVETGNRPELIELVNTTTGMNFFPYTFMVNTAGLDVLNTHQETRLYVLQNTTPVCQVALAQGSNGAYGCNISGYLVDVPTGNSNSIVVPPGQHKLPFGR